MQISCPHSDFHPQIFNIHTEDGYYCDVCLMVILYFSHSSHIY